MVYDYFNNLTVSKAVSKLNEITKPYREQFRTNECCEKLPVFVSKSNILKEPGENSIYSPQIIFKVPSQKCYYEVWEHSEYFYSASEYKNIPLFNKEDIENIATIVCEEILKFDNVAFKQQKEEKQPTMKM